MFKKLFQIDLDRLALWLIPPKLRRNLLFALVKCLISPIKQVFSELLQYREQTRYWMTITPQVCYLERALNDMFDLEQRRITLTDTTEYLVPLIHPDNAQQPIVTQPEGVGRDREILRIHPESVYDDVGADFNVNVPFSLSLNDENRLKSILMEYKLVSKRFKIIYS